MDLGFLRPLYESDAPVASVHLDTSRGTRDADKEIELRWRHLREELASLGTDEATLNVLEEAIGEGDSRAFGAHGQSLFASDGQLLAAHTLTEPPRQDRATWLPIPDVLPVAVDRGRHLPYVLVALDRVNAHVTAYPSSPARKPAEEHDLTGRNLHGIDVMSRGGPGNLGGYNGRFPGKHVAQDMWRENTAKVAEHVRDAVATVDAEVIFVGGDAEAIAYLRDNLAERRLDTPILVVAGGRGGPDAEERLHEAAAEALREFVEQGQEHVAAEYQRKLAHDQAVSGTEPTLPMLSEARVRTLLVGAERDREPQLWGSPNEPVLVGVHSNDMDDPNTAFRAPASALMLRSAVMSDSGFTELREGGEPSTDIGAILRYAGRG
ncbi:hypothetical protein KIK06_07345 [Nocardiopsis sp. EMB25]|uniref:baeRF2 domain-containing protein n=1 Tax=Nocardiopsis sp. EMB25 TaxID=2835867 RepID=UPI0022841D50|nr:hypothetical protein [Nocardiopsis sp. EMB25]MCY9783705.1 hypothetical protein [Nocardiopsis sp. EMB25]